MIVVGGPVYNRRVMFEELHFPAVSKATFAACPETGAATFWYLVEGPSWNQHYLRTGVHLLMTGDPESPIYNRHLRGRDREIALTKLARVRNLWLEHALKSWPNLTHLWVVDSDILPAEDCLARLLALDKPVAGAFVPATRDGIPMHMEGMKQTLKGTIIGPDTNVYTPYRQGTEAIGDEPRLATTVAGNFLIRRDVIDAGARWGYHPQDENVFFSLACRDLGIELWVDPLAKCEHLLAEDE